MLNITRTAIYKKLFGNGGGVVVCESKTPSKENTIAELKGLSVSYPNATQIGLSAFRDCYYLTSIDAPTVTYVDAFAFHSCGSLTSVNLPKATFIGEDAFNQCSGLTSISLPNATEIDCNAFQACFNLTNISIPNATIVGQRAFSSCFGLTVIDLPNVTSIGESAFDVCTNLQGIILRTTETVCVIDPNAIVINADENGTPTQLLNVYVPTAMFEYYRGAYEPAFEEYGFAGYFDVLFHKIEEHPEFCGG